MGDVLEGALFLSLSHISAFPSHPWHGDEEEWDGWTRLTESGDRGGVKRGLVPTGMDKIKGKSDYFNLDLPAVV